MSDPDETRIPLSVDGEGVRGEVLPTYILDTAAPALDRELRRLLEARLVCLVGLPATGKSLLVQQAALLGLASGRRVRTLQWDIARPALQLAPTARLYPDIDGITPEVVIRATGLWARAAAGRWAESASDNNLLIVEAPLIGGRFRELVAPADDAVEAFLASDACQFALVLPSGTVRTRIETERARRHETPQHALEREDASPDVLRLMWRDLLVLARELGIEPDEAATTAATFEPALYRAVYEHLLSHRHARTLAVDVVLPASDSSPYAPIAGVESLVPSLDEAEAAIAAATGA